MERQHVLRIALLTGAAVALFVGLFALVVEVARHDLTGAGWAVAIAGPVVAVALSFLATRLAA